MRDETKPRCRPSSKKKHSTIFELVYDHSWDRLSVTLVGLRAYHRHLETRWAMTLGSGNSIVPYHNPTVRQRPANLFSPLFCQQVFFALPFITFIFHAHLMASSSSNFQLIINNALDAYKKRTKKDLL